MRPAPCFFQRLFDLGTTHVFGIPSDHVLALYEALADSPIRSIVITHEPSAGFVADAYARVTGIGVAMGTYGTGGPADLAAALRLTQLIASYNDQVSAGKTSHPRLDPQIALIANGHDVGVACRSIVSTDRGFL